MCRCGWGQFYGLGVTASDVCKLFCYATADLPPILCRPLQVSCTPLTVFYDNIESGSLEEYIVRFAICKQASTIKEACVKLAL